MIKLYISIGLGIYLGLAIARRTTFVGASLLSIFKGIILGIFLWPLGLYIVYNDVEWEEYK